MVAISHAFVTCFRSFRLDETIEDNDSCSSILFWFYISMLLLMFEGMMKIFLFFRYSKHVRSFIVEHLLPERHRLDPGNFGLSVLFAFRST